uniref:NusB protein n=6 Tax=Enterobacteriaceae TaxID=543 RepID=P71199_ECOLX|nr:ssaD1 is an amber mutant of nusB whose CDS normally ends at nucleotide 536; GTG start codon [Escherichia coli]
MKPAARRRARECAV